jgi:uncharacterized repeat protein (TIGR02543 family)
MYFVFFYWEEEMKQLVTLFLVGFIAFFIVGCTQDSTYQIVFDTNGGTEVETLEIDSSTDFVFPENPTKSGYEFGGWFLDNETYENPFDASMATEDITLYAKWNAMDASLSTTLFHIYTLTTEAGEFDGTYEEWLESVKGEQGVPGEDGRDIILQVNDGYIQWQYNGDKEWTNLISLEALTGKDGLNGATGAPGADGLDGLSAYEIYKSYHKEYTGTEEEWINAVVNGTLQETTTFTVSFDTGEGSKVDSQEVALGYKVVEPDTPVREGYTFDGWYINGSDEWVFYGYGVSEDITLEAKWTINTRLITFHDSDGRVIGGPYGYDYGASLGALEYPNAPVKDQYLFIGWDTDLPETMPDENINVTARYLEVASYSSSTLNSGFGSYVSMNSDTFVVGADLNNVVYQYEYTSLSQDYLYASVYSDDGDDFGDEVVLTENYLIIASPGYNNHQGRVYVRPLSSPSAEYIYSGTGTDSWDDFGASIDLIDDRFLLVGAPGYNDNQGAVYVYDLLNNDYERIIYGSGSDAFGSSLVGQQAYVFEYFDMSTSQMASITISGDYFAVVSPLYNSFEGKITVYSVTDDTYERVITVDALEASDYFGAEISFADHYLIATAEGYNDGQGAVYLFQVSNESYERLITDDAYSQFGVSMFVNDTTLYVGSYGYVHEYKLYDSAYELHIETETSALVSDLVNTGDYIVASLYVNSSNAYIEIINKSNTDYHLTIPQPTYVESYFGYHLYTNGTYVIATASQTEDGYGRLFLFDPNDFE